MHTHTYFIPIDFQYPKHLKSFLRMSVEVFDELLHIVGPAITRQDTSFKESIQPEDRLAVSLHYLATGTTSGAVSVSVSSLS